MYMYISWNLTQVHFEMSLNQCLLNNILICIWVLIFIHINIFTRILFMEKNVLLE